MLFIPPWNGNGTHLDGESSQVLFSHLYDLSETEYGAVFIYFIAAVVVTALEVVSRSIIIDVSPEPEYLS